MNIVESIIHSLGTVGDCARDCLLYRWCSSGTAKFNMQRDCILSNAADLIIELQDKVSQLQADLDLRDKNDANMEQYQYRNMTNVDRCVCCGRIVPEGRSICIQCERQIQEDFYGNN